MRGLLHVQSYTSEPADLARYAPLTDEAGRHYTLHWAGDGIAAISELIDGGAEPIQDRDAAAKLTNRRLYVDRALLPPPDDDEFYLADLVGLAVTGDGLSGRVAAVHDYGAGTSLEIAVPDRPPLLVPFTRACVPDIDLAAGTLRVLPPIEQEPAP